MEPFIVILEVEIFESNGTDITYRDTSGLLQRSYSAPDLGQLKKILYNSHLRSVIPDLIAGSGRRKNKLEIAMTYEISKALGFEQGGKIVAG